MKIEDIKLTPTQQAVVDRYMKATEDCPEARMPIAKLLAMKNHIPRSRPDKAVLAKCEKEFLAEGDSPIKSGRKQRQIDNTKAESVFYAFEDYYQAVERFYWLDDIITGVCRLDLGGNTRPLSRGVIYNFISTSTIINTDIIMAACDVQMRQAQKILLSVGIAVRMIEKELIRMKLVV